VGDGGVLITVVFLSLWRIMGSVKVGVVGMKKRWVHLGMFFFSLFFLVLFRSDWCRYAELLSDMRTHTLLAVNEHHTESYVPPSFDKSLLVIH
jgi:hypothetical protein